MKMSREELKNEIIRLHKIKGIKYSWFTDQIGIHRNNLSYFINDKREISDYIAKELEKLIKCI